MPTTSVIITTHNRPQLLHRAVASAHAAGSNLEVVVVDDASTDDTASVCRQLSNINYVRLDRNQGVAGARNVGILSSTGDYLTFLDDDDVRLPGSLGEQVRLLESDSNIGLVYGQAIVANEDGEPTDKSYPARCATGKVFWELVQQNFIPCGSALFRRACVLKLGMLDERLPGIDDWDFWIRIAELYDVAAVDHPVMIWRRSHPTSDQGTSDAVRIVKLATRQFPIWMKLPTASRGTAIQRRQAWKNFSQNLASHLVWDAGRAFSSTGRRRAAEDILLAMRFHPRGLVSLLRHRKTLPFLKSQMRPS